MRLHLKMAGHEHRAELEQKLQVYLKELSQYAEIPKENGVFAYPYFEFYWQAELRFPWLLLQDDEMVGFAFVRQERDRNSLALVTELAEFTIFPEYRRRGFGAGFASQVFSLYPGQWQLTVIIGNYPAYDFWLPLLKELDPEMVLEQTKYHWEFLFRIRP